MSLFNREKAFETKLNLLEQRLVLVERFVEMRFCESFRNFSIRNGKFTVLEQNQGVRGSNNSKNNSKITIEPKDTIKYYDDDDGDNYNNVQDYVPPTRTRSGRSTRRPARLSAAITPTSAPKRETSVRLQVIRVKNIQEDSDATFTSRKSTTTGNATTALKSEPVVIKSSPLSDDEATTRDNSVDEYFIFPHDDGDDAEQQNTNETTNNEDFDTSVESQEYSDEEFSQRKKRKISKKSVKRKGVSIPRGKYRKKSNTSVITGSKLVLQNSTREECSVCHKYFKKQLMPSHMEFHTKERHLKCSYCDKTFFNKSMVVKHEKLHQPEKYAKQCRLCDKKTIETGKMLVHERSCIRRALEQGKHVDSALLEEIRRRSQGIELKWPNQSKDEGNDSSKKKCSYCSKYLHVNDYYKHVKTHATWVCTLCANSYINKEGLVKHMRKVHGATDNSTNHIIGQPVEDNADKLHSGNNYEDKPSESNDDAIQLMIGGNEISAKNQNDNHDDDPLCKVTHKQHEPNKEENESVNFTLVDTQQHCLKENSHNKQHASTALQHE